MRLVQQVEILIERACLADLGLCSLFLVDIAI